MFSISNFDLVSVHGGHSGQFCCHAVDTLEEVVKAYISKGFSWVGITEHMPPVESRFIYPDEVQSGFNLEMLKRRFGDYIKTCRKLQDKFASQICLYVGFEAESYSGALEAALNLRRAFQPDYIVGSVHHVENIPIDMDLKHYEMALKATGGHEGLYLEYFDIQYEMLATLKPEVVGHFDLIRIFDPNYVDHLNRPSVWDRVCRNLELIQKNKMILDFNLRALSKGATEPYVSSAILKKAIAMGISVVPGDDSHGISSVGANISKGIEILAGIGANTNWTKPVDPGCF